MNQRERFEARYRSLQKYPSLREIRGVYFSGIEVAGGTRGDRNALAVAKLRERLPPGAKVLVLGCGPGFEVMYLQSLGYRVVGMDLALAGVRLLVERGGIGVVGDAGSLPFREGSFDGIFGLDVLHHLTHVSGLGLGLWRVLRPGGVAVFGEPLGNNPGLNLVRKIRAKILGRVGESFPGSGGYSRLGLPLKARVVPIHVLFIVKRAFGFVVPRWARRPLSLLRELDRALLAVPGLDKLAGEAVVIYEKA